ncbi:hypothetical protein BH11BAC3_BH11BAC3_46520 [soil metagenome]
MWRVKYPDGNQVVYKFKTSGNTIVCAFPFHTSRNYIFHFQA